MKPLEKIPLSELSLRHERLRETLEETCPTAEGILLFSRVTLYWLSGTLCNGMLWLPRNGEPVLLVRRSHPRALMESSLPHIYPYHTFAELPLLTELAGSPLPSRIAVEMNALSFDLGRSLERHISPVQCQDGSGAVARARAVKTPFEIARLKEAGRAQRTVMSELFPQSISPGMNERELSRLLTNLSFDLGHCGLMRTSDPGNEVFVCGVAAGENSNYPSHFNGPMGQCGAHPAVPVFGDCHTLWEENQSLMADMAFSITGYHTDKTQVYWSGNANAIPDDLLKAQEFCIHLQNQAASRLKPGVSPSDIWEEAVEAARAAGYMAGFMGLGESKVPFLGHGIGLCIDEYPAVASRFDSPLKKNMVLALEPKISIPGKGMVGVENTYVVTDNKAECLTACEGDNLGFICIRD